MQGLILNRRNIMALAALLALAAPFAAAQERGEEILGTITRVDGRDLMVKHEDGRDIRISVTPSTEVYFRDSGDRKLFPDPTIADLREGMGVRFVYGTGTPDRIVVHYVPAGHVRQAPAPQPQGEQLRVRVQAIGRDFRSFRADVAGRSRTFYADDDRLVRSLRTGDLVVVTVENHGGRDLVVRVDPADYSGVITRIGVRSRSVTIDVNGREETYPVADRDMLDGLREGDRVRFEVDERGGGRVITDIRRDKRGSRILGLPDLR